MLLLEGDTGNGLAARLLKLAKYVREQVSEGRQSGTIVEVATPYVKASVTNFSYGDQGHIGMATSFEYVQKPEWHWRHQHTFAQQAIHASMAFRECIPSVAAENAIPGGETQAEFQLSQFVGALMSKLVDTQSDKDLVDFLSVFIADLHGAPMNISVSAWLDGLWLATPSLTVSGIQLRRPTATDFEYERVFDMQLAGLSDPWGLLMPPAIALFQVRGMAPFDAQKEVGAMLNALRLYRLGSVHSMKYTVSPNRLLKISSGKYPKGE
jgi:hypothetical protein